MKHRYTSPHDLPSFDDPYFRPQQPAIEREYSPEAMDLYAPEAELTDSQRWTLNWHTLKAAGQMSLELSPVELITLAGWSDEGGVA